MCKSTVCSASLNLLIDAFVTLITTTTLLVRPTICVSCAVLCCTVLSNLGLCHCSSGVVCLMSTYKARWQSHRSVAQPTKRCCCRITRCKMQCITQAAVLSPAAHPINCTAAGFPAAAATESATKGPHHQHQLYGKCSQQDSIVQLCMAVSQQKACFQSVLLCSIMFLPGVFCHTICPVILPRAPRLVTARCRFGQRTQSAKQAWTY